MKTLPHLHEEKGSISPAAITLFLALMIVIGLVVDGGAKAAAITTSQNACSQAVRSAGQNIYLDGGVITVNRAAALADGQAALNTNSGTTGTIAINGTTITCTAATTTKTTFLNLIGIQQVTGTATSTADLTTGIQEANK